jgi:FkbM family methyltransferase
MCAGFAWHMMVWLNTPSGDILTTCRKLLSRNAVESFRQFISPDDFVIDIGAHSGDTSVPMALAAGPSGYTLAIEPNPYVYKVLAANAALNRTKTNIVPRCCAATQEDGDFVFHYSDASFCNGGFKSQQRWRLYRRKYPLTIRGQNLAPSMQTEFAVYLSKLSPTSKSMPRDTIGRSLPRSCQSCASTGP